jgi:phosphate starvation-inducible protein PhoH
MPISFIRGITFDDAVIILDEAQNADFHLIDSVITRLGNNSRIIVCGDYTQSDLKRDKDKNGIVNIMGILEKMEQFSRIEFGEQDIVRSKFVKDYIIEKHKQGY